MKQAFLSVSNKNGIDELAIQLLERGVRLLASEGTARYLQSKNIPVTSISEKLQLQPLLDGRIKTLHPTLYAGILAEQDNPNHMNDMLKLQFDCIDLVVVDLYSFSSHMERENDAIEYIDIGGVSLIRAAAKNYKYCTVICDIADYENLLAEMCYHAKDISLAFRKQMAIKAFRASSAFDATVANWLADNSEIALKLVKSQPLFYGENPHQQAGFYKSPDVDSCFTQLNGKELSYNNFLDLDAGVQLIQEFTVPAAVVIKHTNPCGIALSNKGFSAIEKAIQADSKSAFGGILITNQTIDEEAAWFLNSRFFELIAAKDFTSKGLSILSQKPKLRILKLQSIQKAQEIRSILNGYLIQNYDETDNFLSLDIPTQRKPTVAELTDLKFAFTVVKHVKSNAIVIAQQQSTLGLGIGQTSRIDAVDLAIRKALVGNIREAVLASDGFFPFPDSIESIAAAGIRAIIQPGGSIKDNEIIAACDNLGVSMVLTGKRVFRH